MEDDLCRGRFQKLGAEWFNTQRPQCRNMSRYPEIWQHLRNGFEWSRSIKIRESHEPLNKFKHGPVDLWLQLGSSTGWFIGSVLSHIDPSSPQKTMLCLNTGDWLQAHLSCSPIKQELCPQKIIIIIIIMIIIHHHYHYYLPLLFVNHHYIYTHHHHHHHHDHHDHHLIQAAITHFSGNVLVVTIVLGGRTGYTAPVIMIPSTKITIYIYVIIHNIQYMYIYIYIM